ncbi:MAG: CatB-related O-acetyltransferase [Thermoanaerobaculia bacterium]
MTLGRYSFIAFEGWLGNADVGRFCSIGPRAIIGIGRHPSRGFVSSHPAFYQSSHRFGGRFGRSAFDEAKRTTIGSDVWIGANAFVSAGVTIGHGAIVGAGAFVNRNVEPYEVVGGLPARTIRYRYTSEEREWLLQLCWWDWTTEQLENFGWAFQDIATLKRALVNRSREQCDKSD